MAEESFSIVHHYPPELMAILIDAIPHLVRGKKDVLTFFKGAGVTPSVYADITQTLDRDSKSINKFEIVRTVLTRLNDKGERTLRERREIVKRVPEWDDFSGCWDNDRMKAKGYVAEIQKLVNVKDSFTRIKLEHDQERRRHIASRQSDIDRLQRAAADHCAIKAELFALFVETDAKKRGTALEGVLNRLFTSYGIAIREAFRRVGNSSEGVVEQIDGVVEFDGHVYLVEMKWWSVSLGVPEVSQHLVRIYHRNDARGKLISYSGYSDAAIATCREALQHGVCVLSTLEEVCLVLERNESLTDLFRAKVRAAILDKEPFVEPLKSPV